MTPSLLPTLARLTDDDLLAEVKRLARCERNATAELIAHLAELDARRLYLGAGFASLFVYCVVLLRLSEHEAYNRIEAARAARRFPVILDLLRDGSVNLTTIRLLAPRLGAENHRELLAAASGRSRREVEELLACRFPSPPVASSVRKLPDAKPRVSAPGPAPGPQAGGDVPPAAADPARVDASRASAAAVPSAPAFQPHRAVPR